MFSKVKYTVSETKPISASRRRSARVSGSRCGRRRHNSQRMPPASAKRSRAMSSGSKPRRASLVATNESPNMNVMAQRAA